MVLLNISMNKKQILLFFYNSDIIVLYGDSKEEMRWIREKNLERACK